MAKRRSRFRAFAGRARGYSRAHPKVMGFLMNGLTPKSGKLGLIDRFLVGMGAATLSDRLPMQVSPYQKHAIAFVAGGLPGVAGSLARDYLAGSLGKVSSGSGAFNY